MNFKSIFCTHKFNYENLILPDGTKRIKEHCPKCGKNKIYCNHDYELLGKTQIMPTIELGEFKGGISAFRELSKSTSVTGAVEYLFKCRNCQDVLEKILAGQEIKQ